MYNGSVLQCQACSTDIIMPACYPADDVKESASTYVFDALQVGCGAEWSTGKKPSKAAQG